MDNIATSALEKASRYRMRASEIFKEKGKMPYGKVKATPKEQREKFEGLTYPELLELRDKYGVVELQKYIKKMTGRQ